MGYKTGTNQYKLKWVYLTKKSITSTKLCSMGSHNFITNIHISSLRQIYKIKCRAIIIIDRMSKIIIITVTWMEHLHLEIGMIKVLVKKIN